MRQYESVAPKGRASAALKALDVHKVGGSNPSRFALNIYGSLAQLVQSTCLTYGFWFIRNKTSPRKGLRVSTTRGGSSRGSTVRICEFPHKSSAPVEREWTHRLPGHLDEDAGNGRYNSFRLAGRSLGEKRYSLTTNTVNATPKKHMRVLCK